MKASVVDWVYNVCTGHQTSIADLAALLIDLTGQDVDIDFHPEEVSFVRNRIGDPARAFGELGFRAETELVDGLRELIEWRRSNLEETVQQ